MKQCIRDGVVLLILCTSLVSCTPSKFTRATTPDAAVEQLVLRQMPATAPSGLTLLQTRQFDDFAVVLFHTGGTSADEALHYQIAYHDRGGWYTKECCDGGGSSLTPVVGLDNLIRIATSASVEPRFVYGRASAQNVAAIEATFDNGETVLDDIQDSMFMVLSETGRNICTLRVLDTNGRVLGQAHLSRHVQCS